MKLIKRKEQKEIMKKLDEQFGIKKLPGILLRFGKEKIRLYTGNLNPDQVKELDRNFNLETTGIYFLKEEKGELRISFDSIYLLKDKILKNILNVNDKEAIEWLKGNDINIKTTKGMKVIENDDKLLGCGKSTGEDIKNFVPKERRIKN